MDKNRLNKNIRIAFFLYIFLFGILVVYFTKLSFFDSKNMVNTPLNPRVQVVPPFIEKGDFYSKDMVKLTDRGAEKTYIYDNLYAHTIGYSKNGISSLEAWQGLTLSNASNELYQSIKQYVTDEGVIKGDSIGLTIDHNLQLMVADMLSNKTGAILVMNPTTNNILASYSSPSFDPNNVNADVLNSGDNSQLINRVNQGLYPPASTFKVVSTLAFIRNYEDYENYRYTCTGEIVKNGETISCYNHNVHGEIGLKEALTHSCNTFFISLSDYITKEQLEETANSLLFNQKLDVDFDVNASVFPSLETDSDFYHALIGQGDVLITPLHLGTIFSAIANGGVSMQPQVVGELYNYNLKSKKVYYPKKLAQLITLEESIILSDLLDSVAYNGTASALSTQNYGIVSKTGTAEVLDKADHGIFVGYAPKDNPKVMVTILYENIGGSSYTLSDVQKIFDYCLLENLE
ncbi:MAG: penicillin-binding transpeptidase domain-containing protein [Lachnospirales bacterium]